jgi:quercetin dioxygenase-like cupin family protein
MACHASTLAPGHSPHPLHAHVEEELLIAIDGKAEIVIGDDGGVGAVRTEYLKPGDFVYHPAFRYHTIRNPQKSRITYLMFKWQGAPNVKAEPLQAFFCRPEGIRPQLDPDPSRHRVLLEHPTAYLRKLHAHVTDLGPGDGYDPHADDYDVAIVLLSGKVETLGRIVEPLSVIYYAAGELHGMRNVGDRAARYLAFEFHAQEHRRFDATSTKACPRSVVIPAPMPPTDDTLMPSQGPLPSWKRLLQALRG